MFCLENLPIKGGKNRHGVPIGRNSYDVSFYFPPLTLKKERNINLWRRRPFIDIFIITIKEKSGISVSH
jgi:hypothetical protein